MTFIGVFSNRKEYEKLKRKVAEYNLTDIELININNKNVDSLKHIKFDLIIITDNIKSNLRFENYELELVKLIIDNARVIMINIDIDIGDILSNHEYSIISYGFNGKATITLSSITDDQVIICIQREIKNVKGNIIESKEIDIQTHETNSKNLYITMIATTIFNIYLGKI